MKSARGSHRHLTPDEVQRIRDLRAAGESYAAIARVFGVTDMAVRYHCDTRRRANALANNRRWNLGWNYGITIGQYEAALAAQDGGCAICGGLNRDGRVLFVDHDHDCCPSRKSCGKCIRGLLCFLCNTRLTHGLQLSETFLSRREFNYLHLWRKRIARERPNPWDEIRERAA